jgi:hypothetical protein
MQAGARQRKRRIGIIKEEQGRAVDLPNQLRARKLCQLAKSPRAPQAYGCDQYFTSVPPTTFFAIGRWTVEMYLVPRLRILSNSKRID